MDRVTRIPGVEKVYFWDDPQSCIPEWPLSFEDWGASFWEALGLVGAKNPDGFVRLGRLLGADPGGWVEAALLERAVELGRGDVLFELGVVRRRQRRRKAARRAWRAAFADGDKRAALALAADSREIGSYRAAIKWAIRANDLEWTPWAVAEAQGLMHDDDDRKETLERTKESSGEAAAKWTLERYEGFRLEEAIRLLEEHRRKGTFGLGIVLADLYEEADKPKKALRVLREDHAAGVLYATFNLGLLLIRLGYRRKGLRSVVEAAARGDEVARAYLRDRRRELRLEKDRLWDLRNDRYWIGQRLK